MENQVLNKQDGLGRRGSKKDTNSHARRNGGAHRLGLGDSVKASKGTHKSLRPSAASGSRRKTRPKFLELSAEDVKFAESIAADFLKATRGS